MFFFKKLFKKVRVNFNIGAKNIPESLGYPLDKFDILTNTLVNYIDDNNKVVTFAAFIEEPHFGKFELDLTNPNHATVLGYALCTAIVLKHNIETRQSAEQALKVFYPPINKNVSRSRNN